MVVADAAHDRADDARDGHEKNEDMLVAIEALVQRAEALAQDLREVARRVRGDDDGSE